MQLISRVSALAPESRFRLSALLPLVGWLVVVGIQIAAVRKIEPIILAGWFDHGEHVSFSELGARWTSIFVVSLALYGIMLGVTAISMPVAKIAVVLWVRDLLRFLILISWLIGLHNIIAAKLLLGHDGPLGIPFEEEILLASSLVAILWPIACGLSIDFRTVRALFILSVVTFAFTLAILDTDVVVIWAAALRLVSPPKCIVITGYFSSWLPFLVGLPPVLWAISRCWRYGKS